MPQEFRKTAVLVILVVKPTLNVQLKNKAKELVHRLLISNPTLELSVLWDERSVIPLPTDKTPWSRVTRARNRALAGIKPDYWTFILWIDADIVEYPADLPTKLLAANPSGMSAPLVFVEGQSDQWFYDTAGFVYGGQHLQHQTWDWPEEVKEAKDVIKMDCVGCITMVPAFIYKYVQYEDHPTNTDHWVIAQKCKELGLPVTAHKSIRVLHANLPLYEGEGWH